MDLELKDKVVVVTGGAKGIGAGIVRTAAAEGAIPVIVDRDLEAGNLLHAQLRGSDLVIADLELAESCYAVVDRVARKFGRLDVLVNNTADSDTISAEDGTPKEYFDALQQNLLHYYNMAHFALPHLRKSKGCIINIVAMMEADQTSGYASSKGAILALTREWAAELTGYGIRVNAIIPVRNTRLRPSQVQVLAKIARERESEEIGAMVVFLLSARAAHITAQHFFPCAHSSAGLGMQEISGEGVTL
jgi:L-fucose dehydrogenase